MTRSVTRSDKMKLNLPGVGACRRTPGGWVFAHGTWLGTAWKSNVGPPSSRLTTRRRVQKGSLLCDLGGSRGRGPRRPNPLMVTLDMGTWNVTSLVGKGPELVREIEWYRLEIVGPTPTPGWEFHGSHAAPHFGLDAPWKKKKKINKNHCTATVAFVPLALSKFHVKSASAA